METQEVSPVFKLLENEKIQLSIQLLLERLEGHTVTLTTHRLRGQRLEARGLQGESPDNHLLLWVGILKVYTLEIRVGYK